MTQFKPGVPLFGLQPDTLWAIDQCNAVYQSLEIDCVVTSTTDGKHMDDSRHYVGYAIDLRIWNIPADKVSIIHSKLKRALGSNYDVVLESDHFHVEFDPK